MVSDSSRRYIGVDIGGTQLRAALFASEGIEPLALKIIPTQAGGEDPLDRLKMLIQSIWPKDGHVEGIGVGVASPLNPKTGIVYRCPNIAGWVDLPLGPILTEQFKTPVVLGNDANVAALAEWRYGAGVGHHDLLYLTISTGIGGGVITNDRLLVGGRGIAAEVGHITVDPAGPFCGCGQRGHLEAMASGTAIGRYLEEQIALGRPSSLAGTGQVPTARLATEAAARGDALALEAFERAGTYLGRGIADLLHIYDPTIVVLGGGVIKAGDLLMKPVNKALKASVMSPSYLDGLVIANAKLGDHVGLIGAVALVRV